VKREALVLSAVVLAGLALRVRGLDWGLPWALHIDERLFVVAQAIQLERSLVAADGVPDPAISSYGILPLWLLVIARKLFLPWAAAGDGPPVFGDPFAATVLIARWISALWGTATILLAARWARRWGAGSGLAPAALVAGFPALVQASHFGTVEAPLVGLMAAGMLAAERLAERPGAARAAAAGVLLGLCVSVKAPGAVLALPMLHAARAGAADGRVRRAVIVIGVAAALALLLNPGLLAPRDPGERTGEHMTLAGNLSRAYSGEFHDWTLPYADDLPVWTELTRVLPYAVGIVPELLALAGLAVVARRRSPCDVRLLLLLLPILALVFPARVKTVRFLLPAVVPLAILASEAVFAIGWRAPRLGAPLAVAVCALTLLHGAAFSAVFVPPDSRVAAARWLDENAGPRDIVVVEDPPGYGPPIGSPSGGIPRPALRYEILWRGFYAIHERLDDDARRGHIEDVLRRADILVLSEGHREEFTTAGLRPVEAKFYADLDAGNLPFEKVRVFKTYPRLGPLVLPDDGAEVLMRIFDHPRIEIWRRTGE
jgi:hypothetical protein